MQKTKLILLLLVVSIGILTSLVWDKTMKEESLLKNYIIAETGTPDSLDPLDADNSRNLPAVRMLMLTPIEISNNDELTSRILSSFSYNQKNKTIKWIVADNIKYSDGTIITPEDVAFAVSRMVYTRNNFPVIRYIEGKNKWLHELFPLKSFPSGIKITKKTVEIKLIKDVSHPLYRFALELFSIIPKKCVNLETNEISSTSIPYSGYYHLKSSNPNEWSFEIREENSSFPSHITFKYWTPEKLISNINKIDHSTVVSSNDSLFQGEKLAFIHKNASIKSLVYSRISMFLLNPSIFPFNTKECRNYFSDKVRTEFEKLSPNKEDVKFSIFTNIVQGSMSNEDLKNRSKIINNSNTNNCLDNFTKKEFKLTIHEKGKESLILKAITNACNELKMNLKIKYTTNSKELQKSFLNGQSFMTSFSTGFWPFDPVGDLQMLFTPNLHKELIFVSKRKDFQKDLKQLDELSTINLKENLKKINQNIYDDALLNVYRHFSRTYITSKENPLTNLPISVTSPAPWQVFMDKY